MNRDRFVTTASFCARLIMCRPGLCQEKNDALYAVYMRREGRDCSVGMATCYGLDGPGIESRWGRDFPHQASYTMGMGSMPGVNRPVRGVDSPPHLAPRLKKEKSYISTPPLGLRGLF